MATKKDLVEAYSFSRRRLVTAFLSGAPGGREVEPSRPGRTVVGGLALAVLLIAGAAIASVLASRTEEDWNKVGLVVSREEAAPYVILEEADPPTLIPVINITSAQLILGADIEPTYVDQEVVEDQTPLDPIGIAGAPQTLPRPKQFIESGWTACTDDGVGIKVDVSNDRKVAVPKDGGILVENNDSYYLIATSSEQASTVRAHRYLLPETTDDGLLTELFFNVRAEAISVPNEWLELFPEGGELGPGGFDLPDGGQKLDDPSVPRARVGDYVEEGDQAAMITNQGWQVLDPFSLKVLQHLRFPDRPKAPQPLDVPFPSEFDERSYLAANWPQTEPEQLTTPPCARLVVDQDHVPYVELAADAKGSAAASDAIPEGDREVSIDLGHGAFVRVGDWDETTSSSTYVIDPRGKAYQLQGADTLTKLRYEDTDEPLIPDPWLKLFDEGVSLSTSQALCPPANVPGEEGGTCQVLPS